MQPPGNACCSTLGPARFHLSRSDCCRVKLLSSQSLMLQDRPAFIWTAGGIVIRSGVNLNKPYILTAVHLFRNNYDTSRVELFKWFVNHCTTIILIYSIFLPNSQTFLKLWKVVLQWWALLKLTNYSFDVHLLLITIWRQPQSKWQPVIRQPKNSRTVILTDIWQHVTW